MKLVFFLVRLESNKQNQMKKNQFTTNLIKELRMSDFFIASGDTLEQGKHPCRFENNNNKCKINNFEIMFCTLD